VVKEPSMARVSLCEASHPWLGFLNGMSVTYLRDSPSIRSEKALLRWIWQAMALSAHICAAFACVLALLACLLACLRGLSCGCVLAQRSELFLAGWRWQRAKCKAFQGSFHGFLWAALNHGALEGKGRTLFKD
jgi:hypothetical protein